MKQIFFLLFIIGCCGTIFAQSIKLDLPENPSREVTLFLMQGTKNDTIFTGNLDEKGKAVIQLPAEYKSYRGMAAVVPNLPGAYFEFIIAGEDMTLSCPEQYPHGGNVVFKDSPENESLQTGFYTQAIRQQKIGLLSELVQLYEEKENLFSVYTKEKTSLEKEQAVFEDELTKSPLYAARFLDLQSFVNQKVSSIFMADSVQLVAVRNYVRNDLDINSLYSSGMWFSVLNGLLALYDEHTPFHKKYIKDMSLLLGRASSEKVYNSLAEDLFAICESTGWQELEEELAYFLINDGRIKNPTWRLRMLMTLFKLSKGSAAPSLTQGELPGQNTVLVFYESGCGSCENEMQQLRGNYEVLKSKGYEVVSISADSDPAIFENTAKLFPWEQKYCDYDGINGEDFKNYGVIGTPTFYIIKNGIIQGRHARLQDTGILNED